jgi:hypothetical protein
MPDLPRYTGTLLPEHLAAVDRVRDESTAAALSTERCDRPAAEAAVREAYRTAGLAPPELVVWMDSPLGGVFASGVLRQPAIGGQLRGQLGGQLRDQLWGQLGDQLGGQLGDQLWGQLRGQLGDQLRDQLRDQLGDQLGLEMSPWSDAYWLTYYTCALPLAGLKQSPELAALVDATRLLGWWWPMHGVAVLTDRPTFLSCDQEGQLHGDTGPALAYADGYAYYSWHGTRVPADLIDTGWGVERIMAEINAEVRRCAIERMGWARFVTDAELKLADESPDPGNPGQMLRLYDVPRKVLDLPVRVLIAVNGTPERDGHRRQFGLTVPTDCRTALSASAWTYGVTDTEYARLEVRT